MLFVAVLLIARPLLTVGGSLNSSELRASDIEYSNVPNNSTVDNEYASAFTQLSTFQLQGKKKQFTSNNEKAIQETSLSRSAFITHLSLIQSTQRFPSVSMINKLNVEPKILEHTTVPTDDQSKHIEDIKVNKKQEVSIGQRKNSHPITNFKTLTMFLTKASVKNTEMKRKLTDYEEFTSTNLQSKDFRQKIAQTASVETNTITLKQSQVSELFSKKVNMTSKKQPDETSKQSNVSFRTRPSTSRIIGYRGDAYADIERYSQKKIIYDTVSTESSKSSEKFRRNKDVFNTSFIPSPTITTPDAQMNDPPFIRGPHISSDLDLLQKQTDLNEKKKKYSKNTEEPPRFKPSKTRVDWKKAKQKWGYAWELHCYIMGSLFAVIACYCFISLLRMHTFARLLSVSYYVTTNVFVLIMCLGKIFYLLYDPYNSTGKQPAVLSYLACDVMYPCITSSFAILFSSLLQSTNIQFLPKFQKLYVLSPLIAFYFSFCITCDIIVGVFNAPSTLLLACQIMYFVLAVWLSTCYFYVYRRVYYSALRKQGEMIRITFTKMHITGSNVPKKLPKPSLSLAVKMMLATTILQIIFCPLLLSGMFFVQELFPNDKNPNPWLWWCYQLFCRIFELSICAIMCFTATLPLKHFEKDGGSFCNVFRWYPCRKFVDCYKKVEAVDFEEHSDNYANLQGFRNCDFKTSPQSRRYQTNSLPTFRTPLTETTNTLPMRHAPYAGRGRTTNHPSVMSLLSYYKSKRNLSLSTNERLNEYDGNICNNALLSSLSDERNVTFRPTSMLYKDNGFIRFRRENDPQQPMEMSDEDRIPEDDDISSGDADSTKADVGSSFCSVLEDDIVHCAASPFYHTGYNQRFRKLSHLSMETTDNSVDLSSDQLSNLGFRNGFTGSVMDFNMRKYGSTCSSESAANSFDVTFFLNGTSPTEPSLTANTTPVSIRPPSSSRSETEEEKTSSVEGHEIMLRSISPIVKRAVTQRMQNLPLNLNLSKGSESCTECERVNIACGTEDITPDSAVYLDLQLSKEAVLTSPDSVTGRSSQFSVQNPPLLTFTDSPSSNETSPSRSTHTTGAIKQSPTTATSQSLVDLRTRNSYVNVSGVRRSSGSFFNKLRGSAFSLNATTNGYEPLEAVEGSQYYLNGYYHASRKKLLRTQSDSKPPEEVQQGQSQKIALQQVGNSSTLSCIAHLGDSGLLEDCKECATTSVDASSQTEWPELSFAAM